MSLLEYGKLILRKVSFDNRLFWKEYRKFRRSMPDEESAKLFEWVKYEYTNQQITR